MRERPARTPQSVSSGSRRRPAPVCPRADPGGVSRREGRAGARPAGAGRFSVAAPTAGTPTT
eukprot:12043736-Alexandrium_andersonii.AAC.1